MRILFVLDSVENPTSANVLMAQRLAGVLCVAGHTVHLLELWDGLHPQPELPGCTVHCLAFADERLMNAALENGRSAVFLGGGATLLKHHASAADGLCRPIILDDVCLNAKGYERLTERMSKKHEQ